MPRGRQPDPDASSNSSNIFIIKTQIKASSHSSPIKTLEAVGKPVSRKALPDFEMAIKGQ